jgi:hypothetical protein
MAKKLLALAALGWLGAAWPMEASAETSIETFRTLCLAKGPNPETIAAAATELGYKPLSSDEVAKAGYHYGRMRAFFLPGDEKQPKLILGVDDIKPGIKANTCVFIYDVDASEDPAASMESLLNVGPPLDLPPSKVFLFTDDGGVLRRATPAADMTALAVEAQGTLRLAIPGKSEGAAFLQVLALIPTSK